MTIDSLKDYMKAHLGTLEISNLKLRARIGCTPEERAYTQNLRFDLTLYLDMTQCMHSDDISHTVDYMAAVSLIERRCAEGEWKLLEKLCNDIAQELLFTFPILHKITFSAQKFILTHAEGVRCQIEVTK